MPRNFARHEQFLRIFALLEILSLARQPISDQVLIATLKERLGLSRLSVRTLHRDCDFLVSCGYPIDHGPLPGDRRYGWQWGKNTAATGKPLVPTPLTLLELVAFTVGRELLRSFEGTVLWTGIESLRHKIERDLPPGLLKRLEQARQVFHVASLDPARYSSRPRLIAALSSAITNCREIEVEDRGAEGGALLRRRLRPLRLVIQPPAVSLLGFETATGSEPQPLLLDIERIRKIKPLDVTFEPPAIDVDAVVAGASRLD